MLNFVTSGDILPFTAGADKTSGAIVVVGQIAGIATTDVASGAQGYLQVKGIVSVPKKTTSETWSAGAKLFHDTAAVTAVEGTTSKVFLGYAVAASLNGDTTAQVLLSRGPSGASA